MKVQIRHKGEVSILDIVGRLTVETVADELRDRFCGLLADGRRLFVLNMDRVPYMDSTGIGETAACGKRANEAGGTIKIVLAPEGKPEQLLRIAYLDRSFEIFHDEEEALASFIPGLSQRAS